MVGRSFRAMVLRVAIVNLRTVPTIPTTIAISTPRGRSPTLKENNKSGGIPEFAIYIGRDLSGGLPIYPTGLAVQLSIQSYLAVDREPHRGWGRRVRFFPGLTSRLSTATMQTYAKDYPA